MSETWHSKDLPPGMPISLIGWFLLFVRAVLLLFLLFGGLAILLILRLVERPFFGLARPITPHITQFVRRNALRILRINLRVHGSPLRCHGALVANHSSWLDIFALNAGGRVYFVSKSEVRNWPVIGWLARATGTVFIMRERKEVTSQIQLFQQRLSAGHRLLFFPEGTSTDGLQVLPFKPSLFASFFAPELYESTNLQAVTLVYKAPEGYDPRFYGWWGNMDFAPHLLSTLAAVKQGSINLVYHEPVSVSDYSDRKKLASALEHQVRSALRVSP